MTYVEYDDQKGKQVVRLFRSEDGWTRWDSTEPWMCTLTYRDDSEDCSAPAVWKVAQLHYAGHASMSCWCVDHLPEEYAHLALELNAWNAYVEDLLTRTRTAVKNVASLEADTGITFRVDDIVDAVERDLPAEDTTADDSRRTLLTQMACDVLAAELDAD